VGYLLDRLAGFRYVGKKFDGIGFYGWKRG
jgi:hypothetical protein